MSLPPDTLAALAEQFMQFMQATGGTGRFNSNGQLTPAFTAAASSASPTPSIPQVAPIVGTASPAMCVAPATPEVTSATAKRAVATSQVGGIIAAPHTSLNVPHEGLKNEMETPVRVRPSSSFDI